MWTIQTENSALWKTLGEGGQKIEKENKKMGEKDEKNGRGDEKMGGRDEKMGGGDESIKDKLKMHLKKRKEWKEDEEGRMNEGWKRRRRRRRVKTGGFSNIDEKKFHSVKGEFGH